MSNRKKKVSGSSPEGWPCDLTGSPGAPDGQVRRVRVYVPVTVVADRPFREWQDVNALYNLVRVLATAEMEPLAQLLRRLYTL
jgi:hypothetical protein